MSSRVRNSPIAYDDHGDIPFDVPFGEIRPDQISIYLQLDTKVGRATCGQTCAHCFYRNQPNARDRSVDLAEGRRIMGSLVAQGYRVFPMISDSFAQGGAFIELFGNTHNRDCRQGRDRAPAPNMRRGELWTSGVPLLKEDWAELLLLGVDRGFGSVTMTFHGIVEDGAHLAPQSEYPIAGVLPGHKCVEVVRRIAAFNEALVAGTVAGAATADQGDRLPLDVCLGVTIGTHNQGRDNLLRYVTFLNALPVTLVRFNRFHDYGWLHPHLCLTPREVADFYADLRWVHDTVELGIQLAVDEDFGTSGIDVMGFPSHTGWCRAGRQLFAIVPDPPERLCEDREHVLERVGTVAACVDAFEPIVGSLLRRTSTGREGASYSLEFRLDALEELRLKRVGGTYADGCFAPALLAEMRHRPGHRAKGH